MGGMDDEEGPIMNRIKMLFFSLVVTLVFLLSSLNGLAQTWTPTGSLGTPRSSGFNLIYGSVLTNGKVLIAGGSGPICCFAPTASAELYDPIAGTFAPTGSMNTARAAYGSAVLLNGKVLFAGGSNSATAEVYDPASGTFAITGSMATPRTNFGLAVLSSGKVLVVGGDNGGNCVTPRAELYDPSAGSFSSTGSTIAPCRDETSVTALSNGTVLVAGGQAGPPSFTNLQSAELYDPTAGTFSATGPMTIPREGHTATLLTNGKVLLTGGNTVPGSVTNSAELYDPVAGTFSPTGSMATARTGHAAVLLSSGQVLVVGGGNTAGFTATAEIYDPTTGTFSPAGSMSMARVTFWSALLSTGKVLVAGGSANSPPFTTAELFTPSAPPIAVVGPDQTVNEGAFVTLDGSGSSDPNGKPLTYAWTQVAGPTVTLSGANTAFASFTAPPVPIGGVTLTFQLSVNNGSQTSIPVTANVTVKHVNHQPVASAGPNQTVDEGAQVTLDGSASYDPDGDVLSYQWTQTGGPTVTLSSTTAVKPTFTAPPVSSGSVTWSFQLMVSDGSLSSTALVTITDEHVNHPPVANAGANQTVYDTKLVTLDGSASSDPDSDPLTYAWAQQSGAPVTLSNPTAVKPTFTAPVVGASGDTLVFQLTVTDPGLLSSMASTRVTVVHQNPVCTAAQPSQPVLWPPNHKLIGVQILGVTDPDNLSTTIAVTAVTQDEPLNGLGDGDTSPDAVIQGQGVLLRAERAGGGNGRVYQITFTATDSKGGTCNGTVTVSVPLDKQGTAVDNGQIYNSLQP